MSVQTQPLRFPLIQLPKVGIEPVHYAFVKKCGVGFRLFNRSKTNLEFEVVAYYNGGANDNEFILFEVVSLEVTDDWDHHDLIRWHLFKIIGAQCTSSPSTVNSSGPLMTLIEDIVRIKITVEGNRLEFDLFLEIPGVQKPNPEKADRHTEIPVGKLRGFLYIPD